MADYQIDFQKTKKKFGIDDVAYSLGYRLNRKKGVGNFFELVLGPADNPIDVILVKNESDKEKQFYFKRDETKGDLIHFIKSNLDSFKVEGANDWVKLLNVIRSLENLPPIDKYDSQAIEQGRTTRIFDPERWETKPVYADKPHWLFTQRGFNSQTLKSLGDSICLIKDRNQTKFDGYNIGFPYRNSHSEEITGFEIRGGKGYKNKASGTDSTNSFWRAEFKNGNEPVENVYLFESAFDAMAFLQMNRAKISMNSFALVSMGGSFSKHQAEAVINRYPTAKLWDCFDNDLNGNLYAKNMVFSKDKIPFEIRYEWNEKNDQFVVMARGPKSVSIPIENFNFQKAAKELGISYSIGHWKAPPNYKDWNDCLLGIPIKNEIPKSKYERDENLHNKRNAGMRV